MIKDVTEIDQDAMASLAIILAACAAIGLALTVFINVVLVRVQKDVAMRTARLAETRRVLAHEQDERQRAEHELTLQQERNELLEGRARMAEELGEANRKAEAALRENEEVTARLREAQSELLATARAAGRAEIATNVLHNVGNVLNSVNVSAQLAVTRLEASKVLGLTRAVHMLQANQADLGAYVTHDPKGRLLPAYLDQVSKALEQEQRELRQELDLLVRNIDHIKDVVATQQRYAGVSTVLEPVQLQEVVEDALRLHQSDMARAGVTVEREFSEVPVVPLDKARIVQILVNLFSNARHAMAQREGQRRMVVRVGQAGGELAVSVIDEGEGISRENLTRIFAHGFTTRRGGHGFGLHSSALVAVEMGGNLVAHSDGEGAGATFTLTLPMQQAATA
jgi:signal transduction histidine kinase